MTSSQSPSTMVNMALALFASLLSRNLLEAPTDSRFAPDKSGERSSKHCPATAAPGPIFCAPSEVRVATQAGEQIADYLPTHLDIEAAVGSYRSADMARLVCIDRSRWSLARELLSSAAN